MRQGLGPPIRQHLPRWSVYHVYPSTGYLTIDVVMTYVDGFGFRMEDRVVSSRNRVLIVPFSRDRGWLRNGFFLNFGKLLRRSEQSKRFVRSSRSHVASSAAKLRDRYLCLGSWHSLNNLFFRYISDRASVMHKSKSGGGLSIRMVSCPQSEFALFFSPQYNIGNARSGRYYFKMLRAWVLRKPANHRIS